MTKLDAIETAMAARAERTERSLADALSEAPLEGERPRPARLMQAIRHGVLGGGKRLRPFLVTEAALLVGGVEAAVEPVATALECIHCYSLIHDDLPAMDDDDLRRGRPTVHVEFDEATAILAGDALMTIAFDLVAGADLPAQTRVEIVSMLARASGVGGMAGGQMLDLMAEDDAPDEAGIIELQAMKTGALLRFAAEGGAVAGGASAEERASLRSYGETVGLAFQIADDLLDVTQTAEQMGKATGKDAAAGKGTLIGLHGMDWARQRLDELVREADATLEPFGERAGTLRALARFVARRDH